MRDYRSLTDEEIRRDYAAKLRRAERLRRLYERVRAASLKAEVLLVYADRRGASRDLWS